MRFFNKIFIELINLFCNNRFAFAIAKKFQLFDAVFVMYPADQEFADYFTFRPRQWSIRWRPFIVGRIKHPNGKRMLVFAISAFIDHKEKESASEAEKLRLLYKRMEVIKTRLGAVSAHFAGTLPGRFTFLKIDRGEDQKNERKATQENVVRATLELRTLLEHDPTCPVVVFGARGYIGKGVVKQLEGVSPVVGVDKVDGSVLGYQKPDGPHIIVDISRPDAINPLVDYSYMDWKTAVLNEVYPAPHGDVVKQMKALGVRVFHVAGVNADVWPAFPKAYQGAVPCCAALHGVQYEVRVVEL